MNLAKSELCGVYTITTINVAQSYNFPHTSVAMVLQSPKVPRRDRLVGLWFWVVRVVSRVPIHYDSSAWRIASNLASNS